MATRKKKTKSEVLESIMPLDWNARKGTTSAGEDGISTDERIIFLRDDLMQFINTMSQNVAAMVRQQAIENQHNFDKQAKCFNNFSTQTRVDLDIMVGEVYRQRELREGRWYRRAWAWFKAWW